MGMKEIPFQIDYIHDLEDSISIRITLQKIHKYSELFSLFEKYWELETKENTLLHKILERQVRLVERIVGRSIFPKKIRSFTEIGDKLVMVYKSLLGFERKKIIEDPILQQLHRELREVESQKKQVLGEIKKRIVVGLRD